MNPSSSEHYGTYAVEEHTQLTMIFFSAHNSRFGNSSLHQRDPRSALFENYHGGANDNRPASSSPRTAGAAYGNGGGGGSSGGYGYGYGYGYAGGVNGSPAPGGGLGAGLGAERPGYRPATPNSRYVRIC